MCRAPGDSDDAIEKAAGLYFEAPDKIRSGPYRRSFLPGTASKPAGLRVSRTDRFRLL